MMTNNSINNNHLTNEVLKMQVTLSIIFRTTLAFVAVLFLTHLLGKTQVSQLTFEEYITGITFGSIAASMATHDHNTTWHYLLGMFVFAFWSFMVTFLSLKSIKMRDMLQGKPVIVIRNGAIMENQLKKMRYNMDDLKAQLREKDCFNLTDVEIAILEIDGELSIIKKNKKQPVTHEDLNILKPEENLPLELIVDGQIIYSNLEKIGLDGKWLIRQLREKGIQSANQVMYASFNQNNQALYIDTYKDK